jgi:hypothetical protein
MAAMLDREEYNLNGKKREREGYSSQPQLDDDAARGVKGGARQMIMEEIKKGRRDRKEF